MFLPILKYELRFWLRSPLSYLFILSVFSIALIMTLGTAGYFDAPTSTNEKVRLLNSPFGISFIYQFLWKLLSFTIPVVVGYSIYRDYQSKMHAVLYAYPVTKSAYLLGKLSGALLIILLMCICMILGLILGAELLGSEHSYIGNFGRSAYFLNAGIFLLPNIICTSLLIFTIVSWSRNIYAGLIGLLLLYIFKLIIEHLFFKQPALFTLLEPFGQHAFQFTTMDWNLDKQNAGSFPFGKHIGYNRLFWLSISTLVFGLFYRQFDFQYNSLIPGRKKLAKQRATKGDESTLSKPGTAIEYNFSWKGRWQQLFFLTKYHFASICRSWLFIGFVLFSLLAILFIEIRVTQTGEFTLLPFTRILLTAPLKVFELLITLITFLFAGRLVHQARSQRMHLLIDATAVKNWQLLGSKLLALSLMQVLLLLFFLICGLLIQLYDGYYDWELSQYVYHLFILLFPVLLIWSISSLMVFTLIPNLFLGLFLLIGLFLGVDMLENFGINTWLLKVNKVPSLIYSDFYAYGNSLQAYFTILGYWLSLSGLSLLLAWLFWNRGTKIHLKERFVLGSQRFQLSSFLWSLLFLSSFSFSTYKIYHAERANTPGTSLGNTYLETFKNDWAPFGKIPQPNIKGIHLELDIYPEENRFKAKGKYLLINEEVTKMDTLLVRTGFDEKTSIQWSQSTDLILQDTAMKYAAYRLTESLNPGDSLYLDFSIESTPNTLLRRNSNVLKNGTLIKHDILPRLSFQFDTSSSQSQHYFSKEADYIQIQTQISTSSDQVAIAPGALLEQRTESGRNIYTFQTEDPVKLNFSFHSGAYEIKKYQHAGTTIELYTLPKHRYNQDQMIAGIKAALDYHQKSFGTYPYTEIRIIEFPHTEGDFSATLTANNIPVSEKLFNLNTEQMEAQLQLPFYVMAHELTHEWFGNQLMPANVPGAKMLTESITEYWTLQIYEAQLGEELAQNFLQIQEDRYLNGSRRTNKAEKPLYQAEADQEYILYGKGAMALNTLAQAIGKEKMQAILLDFFKRYQYQTDIFPSPSDFIAHLKQSCSPLFHTLIEEYFMEIVVYDNRILSIQQADPNTIIAEIQVEQFKKSSLSGTEYENTFLELGQLDQAGRLIQLDSFPLSGAKHFIELERAPKTTRLVLDPRLLWIDQDRRNQEARIEPK